MKTLLIVLVVACFSATPLLAQTGTQQPHSAQPAATAEWLNLKVTGMTCAGCANHIQKALSGKKGILDHEVKYPGDQVKVQYDPTKIKQEDIKLAILALGYKVESVVPRQ